MPQEEWGPHTKGAVGAAAAATKTALQVAQDSRMRPWRGECGSITSLIEFLMVH